VGGTRRAHADHGLRRRRRGPDVDRRRDARAVERDAAKLAKQAATYPSKAGARRYVLHTNDGLVRWSEGSPSLPKVLPKAQLLALQLERIVCRG
jgi:hypothetical protein